MSAQVAADLRAAADVLEGAAWGVAYMAICNSRDMADRLSTDRDSTEVLADLVDALRAAADRAEAES